MLKRYYGLSEAADFLSSEHKRQIGISDVMEMAARGEIRLCLWCDGLLAVFEHQEPGNPPRLLKNAGSFRGYIHIPPLAIVPRGGECKFEPVLIAEEVPPAQGVDRPVIGDHQFIGFIGSHEYFLQLGAAGLRSALASGSVLPIPFTPTIDEMVIPAADLLALSDDSANKQQAYQGLNTLGKKGDCDTYSTPHIAIMNAAIAEFFSPRRQVDPKQLVVVGWINEKIEEAGLPPSNNIAEAIFTIIKPTDHDPRKRRG